MVEDVALHDAFTDPMRTHVERNASAATTAYFDLLGQAAPRRRQAHQEPALPAGAARRLRARAIATSRDMGARLYRRTRRSKSRWSSR